MGSRERYREYFSGHPGTYYYTAGWLERRDGEQLIQAQSVSNALGLAGQTYEEMVETYGEENAQYLMEFFGGWKQHYTHGILIDFPFAEALNLKEQVQAICRENGWQYGEIPGDLSLLERFIGGDWNDDFLVVPPGQSIRATYDECVMKASETGADSPSSDGAIAIKI